MIESTTSDEDAQAATPSTTPQAPAATTPEPPAGDGTNSESISLEEARKLRNEAANLRKRLRAYEEAEKQAADARLSEQEKLSKRLAAIQAEHESLRGQMQERVVNYEVRLQAAQMGIIDPDAAARLLDWSALEYDETGTPTNVTDLLKHLLKARPYLRGGAGTGGQAMPPQSLPANPARSLSTQPQEITWEYLGRITPQEYDARRKEILEFMSRNPPRFR